MNDVDWVSINACGPFPHGYYLVDGKKLSQEGPLEGRADFLVQNALDFLKNLSLRLKLDRSELSILEVGSYDGWMSNQLWQAGFTNIVTLEPRKHNIERGKRVRKLLLIEDEVRHFKGTLEVLSREAEPFVRDKVFDAVISFGVLHHLDDHIGFLRKLRSHTRHEILLESVTLPNELVSEGMFSAIEPKDLVYNGTQKEVSFFGVKLESSILPGSRIGPRAGVVMIPATKALQWSVESVGFKTESIKRGFEKSKDLGSTHRSQLHTNVLHARVTSDVTETDSVLDAHVEEEQYFCGATLSEMELTELTSFIRIHPEPYNSELQAKLAEISQKSDNPGLILALLHAPTTKLKFESAKREIQSGESEKALRILLEIVNNPSDDWRTAYRAFYLLSSLDKNSRQKWTTMAHQCNPEFPLKLN